MKDVKQMKPLHKRKALNLSFLSSIFAVVIGLVCGLIILLISNPAQAMDGFKMILAGGLYEGMKSVGQVLYYATPIILTGLSVGFAFKTGLFNIGASGQYIVGAFAAVLIGVKCPELGAMQWVVALIAAFGAGGLWALLTGVLKAYANVNEVITSIMMNYIGMYMVTGLVQAFIYDSLKAQSLPVASTAVLPRAGLDKVFPGSSVNVGILIAVGAVIAIYILLNRTRFGYELKAVGYNRDASRYAGINEKRSIIMSMVIAGALAGLAGGIAYLAGAGKHIETVDVLAADGFTGIPVALLGLSNPIGILISGIFISYISMGGFYMQLYDFVPEIIDIIIAFIIYFSSFALIVQMLINRIRGRGKPKHAEEDVKIETAVPDSDVGGEGL